MSDPISIVFLSCGHSRSYPKPAPLMGETVLCHPCNKPVTVAEAPHNYRWVCDDCKTKRDYGGAFVTAETKAVAHATRKAGHRVRLLDGDEELRVFYHEPLPVEIPF